jgi:hypothetical protein
MMERRLKRDREVTCGPIRRAREGKESSEICGMRTIQRTIREAGYNECSAAHAALYCRKGHRLGCTDLLDSNSKSFLVTK